MTAPSPHNLTPSHVNTSHRNPSHRNPSPFSYEPRLSVGLPGLRLRPTMGRRVAARWKFVLACAALWALPMGPEPVAAEPAASTRLTWLDGNSETVALERVEEETVVVRGRENAVPFYELSSIELTGGADKERAFDPDAGPLLAFRGRGAFSGRVLRSDGKSIAVLLRADAGDSEVQIPVEALRGFRLREAHPEDALFTDDLKGEPPSQDTVYVRKSGRVFRLRGVFRGIDSKSLFVDYSGQRRSLPRQRVLGVLFAPLASTKAASGFPALCELTRGGSIPVHLVGLANENDKAMAFEVRVTGAASDATQRLPAHHVRRVRFFSDRVRFLSSLKPLFVEETPLVGTRTAFSWQTDKSSHGGPIRVQGKRYRRGLGVHSRTVLEYDLKKEYASFAAVIGLDDSAGAKAGVLFRVVADGKEILRREKRAAEAAETLLLPVENVARLRLEVDYGEDGLDFGDHAVWADARVLK